MTTRQRIDSMRETRLWVTGIGVPVLMYLAASPEAREGLRNTARAAKEKVKSTFNKLFKK